eukprot:TRINITY_DN28408_c0_g2_i1.p1 TRINITY_DN28408_c0_g2~~TRINITY_DN28408_c0_g2_i1.p1  ORF type:complete len:372 (+),score=38.75 TRINITY_DN28408_c0_g2_i1:213-1328(+)
MQPLAKLLGQLQEDRVAATRRLEVTPCSNPSCKASHLGDIARYQKCAGCFNARYCGQACQKQHWKTGHKQECPELSASKCSGGAGRDKALFELDAIVDLLSRHLESGDAAAHYDQLFQASASLAIGTSQPYCLMIKFENSRAARAWRVQKPVPLKVEICTLERLRSSGCKNAADVRMEKMLQEYFDAQALLVYFEVRHSSGVVSRMAGIPDGTKSIACGDEVKLSIVASAACRNAGCQLHETAEVISIDQSQRTCCLRFGCGAEFVVWCCWVKKIIAPSGAIANDLSICMLDETLQGREARKQVRTLFSDQFLAATGRKLSIEIPDVYRKLKEYEERGTPFDDFWLEVDSPSCPTLLVKCFLGGRFSTDVI